MDAARELPGVAPLRVHAVQAHRWRYALVTEPLGRRFLDDPDEGLAVCGDGLLGGRVEAALLSGLGAAEAVLGEVE